MPGQTNSAGLTGAEVLELLKEPGMNQNKIAQRYGVNRQTVSYLKRREEESRGIVHVRTPRQKALEEYPFPTDEQYTQNEIAKRCRDHATYITAGAGALTVTQRYRLRLFYRKLDKKNLVVCFDYRNKPRERNVTGGYELVQRTQSDGDLIIRINRHVKVTEYGRRVWRMPPRLP